MDVQVRVQNCPAHIGHELDTKPSHFLVVILDGFQDVQEMLWDDGIRHPRGLLEPVPVLNGHDARYDRNCDTRLSNSLHPTDEDTHVKEHLGEDPRATVIDFRLEVFYFCLELLWGKEDVFRKAGNSDIEVVAMVLLNVSNEIDPVDKAALNRLPDFFPGWRIPSQSQDIATSMLFSGLGEENAVYSPSDDRI
jgi:hypothetical protein